MPNVNDPTGGKESELLVRHRRGDPQAFAELVARYRGPVYSYLVRCGVEEGTRDDLFQEVFSRIHHAAPTYRSERPVKPWVFAIVANVVRSHYRRARVREVVVSLPDAPVRDETVPDGQALAEARETAAWMESALAALPAAQREVVMLCCVEQLSQDEVAANLGMPLSTVKTNLRRARLALAQSLARRAAIQRREESR